MIHHVTHPLSNHISNGVQTGHILSYTTGVAGIMPKEKPLSNFF